MADEQRPCYLSSQDNPYQSSIEQKEYGYLEQLSEGYTTTCTW